MIYALIFSFMCFALTSFGASTVFFVKSLNDKLIAFLHSFAGGVMVSASIFSLIIPSIDYCEQLNLKSYIILPVCFIFAYFVIHLLNLKNKQQESTKINIFTLNLGIALHNIPEGMCIGFAFASATLFNTQQAFMQAVMIAIGIGIQNIPEGSSVAFPLYSMGYSKTKSFLTSTLVGFLEVPAGIIAYLIGLNYVFILPYMLSFSAGIMLSVAICDLMPEAIDKDKKLSNIFFFVGFILMMLLDLML